MTSSFSLHMRDAERFSRVDGDEEIALAQQIEQGDKKARERLICANIPLVIFVAKRYSQGLISQGFEFLDLIQEGYVALIQAVDSYDWRLGYKFSTFAMVRIQGAIWALIGERGNLIRLPHGVAQDRWKVRAAVTKLQGESEKAPTLAEIAKEADITERRVERILAYEQAALPLSIDDQRCWAAWLTTYELNPEEGLMQEVVKSRLREVVETVGSRSARILKLRFGLEDDVPRTFEQIAKIIGGVSSERVRQLQKEALALLQEKYGRELYGYLRMELRQG